VGAAAAERQLSQSRTIPVSELAIVQLVSLGLAVVACACDLRTRRIPQVLTLGGALAGFAYHLASGGWTGGLGSLAGWFVGIVIFLAPFALGGLGAGDVKLLGALGAWLGVTDVIWLALYTGVAGGAMALLVALARGYLRTALSNLSVLMMHWRVNGPTPLAAITLEQARGPRLAYAVPILAGTAATLWLQ
jgi:prepilin peptidase CpaA